jgi:hypothetical protein
MAPVLFILHKAQLYIEEEEYWPLKKVQRERNKNERTNEQGCTMSL